ncbi:MAG TPA: TRAP transporter fused permease subunit [Geminicoccaceae bacterium]|nr:TRAP transporter fused permease subunit [Geminicoccaceae bacterium]
MSATSDSGDPRARLGWLITGWGVVVSLAHIYFNTFATLPELWVSALHFGSLAVLGALLYPALPARRPSARGAVLALDLLLGMLAMATAVHLILFEQALYQRGQTFSAADWVFSAIAVLLAIEFTRRTTGLIIPIMIVVALTYVAWWGKYVEGVFRFPGLTWETVLYRSYYGLDGMFGPIARISSTYVYMFVLFGAFLLRSGAGEFVIDLARAAAGRLIGGPGLVAVLGSGLMGSISGSAVANTVTTGVITIPLMKRAGFTPRFAAGVEAAASTGGQLMPPIMGAGVFIMSTYTQISYLAIVAVSFLPALMYFLSVAAWVRIEAKKQGVVPVMDDAPGLWDVVKGGGHSLIPIFVLIALLVVGFTPTYAAGISMLAVIAASWLGRTPMGPRAILDALDLGARGMVSTGLLLVAVGLVVNVIATTGIGNTVSLMISDWAGGSLLITIILVGLASLVLGMGLPVTASYVVLATLSAPAIYGLIAESQLVQLIASGGLPEQAKAIFMLTAPDAIASLGQPMPEADAWALLGGVPSDFRTQLVQQALSPAALTTALLSAHMIIFWLSQDSNVTPPVCLTAFAAAAIAETAPMATGLMAWKIAKGLYVVPLLFAYTPFLAGEFWLSLWIFAFGTVGIYALTAAISGWMEAPLSWPERVLAAATGTALLWPTGPSVNVPGFAFFLALFAFNLWRGRRRGARSAAAA